MVPRKVTAKQLSFEWPHHRISSTDSNVRVALYICHIDSGKEMVKLGIESINVTRTDPK